MQQQTIETLISTLKLMGRSFWTMDDALICQRELLNIGFVNFLEIWNANMGLTSANF